MTSPASPGGFVVANPGALPWLEAAGGALVRAGALGRYHAPVIIGPKAESLIRTLPRTLAESLMGELHRRSLPPILRTQAVRRTATSSELLRLAAVRSRLPSSVSTRMLRHHARFFDLQVSRQLVASDLGVLVAAGSARRTLARATQLGVASFLDCSIAHHRTTISLLREEARLVPEFAPTLPSIRILEAMSAELDSELVLADRMLSFSTFETQSFVEAGIDRAHIIQIPPGVDLDLFRPRPRIDDGVFRILFVGQITQRKGISYLLEAFRLARIPRSELVLAGAPYGTTGPWAGTAHVRHRPAVARSELPAAYSISDVYVMPSIVEGSCLTALEAMASGLPIVVSANTGTPDVIEEGREGHVVPIRDSEAIAERLRELYADPDRRRHMGVAARRRAEQLSWEHYGQRVAHELRAATQ